MPRIRYPRPRSSVTRRIPSRFGYKPPVPRADLSKYNVARRVGYKPPTRRADLGKYNAARRVGYQPKYRPPTLDTSQLENMQEAYTRQQASRQAADGTFSGHKEAQRPITTPGGRRVKYVDPALMAKVMSSQPKDSSGAFEQQDFYQGEDFVNYLYEQGIVPHWGSPQAPSGRWVDYLLGKMGITQYGVNPFARPQPQQPVQPAGGGGGGGGYGYPAGGGGYTPPKPKQYGGTRDVQGRNPPQWLLDMVVWTI